MRKNEKTMPITLDNGVKVLIPAQYGYAKCECGADDIIWGITEKNKKNIPIRWDEMKGWIAHFVDCPLADKFRRKNEQNS